MASVHWRSRAHRLEPGTRYPGRLNFGLNSSAAFCSNTIFAFGKHSDTVPQRPPTGLCAGSMQCERNSLTWIIALYGLLDHPDPQAARFPDSAPSRLYRFAP